jgi:hypothetical protein
LGRQHTLANNTHIKSRVSTLFHIHHCSVRFCILQPTRAQSCDYLNITACMADAINSRRDHATSTYLAKYKQTLSYRNHMTNLQFIPVWQKRKNGKIMLIKHTAVISINFTPPTLMRSFLHLWLGKKTRKNIIFMAQQLELR